MATIDYLLLGHITADIAPEGRTLGGTVSYAAPIASQFDHQVGILTSAAPDEPLLFQLMDAATLSVRVAKATTTFENIYPPNASRIQYVHALASKLTYEDIPSGWVNAPLVHLAPLVEEVPPEIVHRFPDSTVMLTPQGWLRQWDEQGKVSFKRWYDEDILSAVDIIVFSKPDVAAAPEMEYEFARAVKHCLVTDGADGGIYYYEGQPMPYRADPVQEVDPTGAGDVFATALLASLPLLDHNMQAAIKVAIRLSAISVTHPGVVVFTPDDINQAIEAARQEFL
ncbi:hypothetical protein G4Y79_13595 [Phototrophicus methaneseepsis]|uniref:Carbohydrate kinase PfkB domain-containing protein n=1 Tax=Phototrophicus methaneseepsis TaxID=2710758 RepID=A0A7S8ICR2_9CHLR|nr:PfkB family carbohydrate kinase [Phototrophicus methaneseepsis]QPC80746.1 hypothetical protein G4Y79_13595 [Phototrophicus methaneseepsis]